MYIRSFLDFCTRYREFDSCFSAHNKHLAIVCIRYNGPSYLPSSAGAPHLSNRMGIQR